MRGTSEYQGGSHHSNNNHGKSYKHPPLHQHLLKNSEHLAHTRTEGEKKRQENFNVVSRNELKVEKLELSSQVSILYPCPGLRSRQNYEGKYFPYSPFASSIQSAVLSLIFEGICSLHFFFWLFVTCLADTAVQNSVTHSPLDVIHVFLMLSHCTGYSLFVKV